MVFGALAAVSAGLLLAGRLRAEPYISVRTGLKCAQCHVNRTGGGKRTAFGLAYAQTRLPMKRVESKDHSALLDVKLGEFLSAGANLRVDDVSAFEFTGSTGERAGASNLTSLSRADLYLQLDLVPEFLMLYIDEALSPTATSREFFGMVSTPRLGAYVKVGRMFLPYGLRLLDDGAFIRSRTGYSFDRNDLGVEVGLTPGAELLAVNLTDTQLTLLASHALRHWRVGGSFGKSLTEGGDRVFGTFGGTTWMDITLLGEIDLIREGGIDRLAWHAEADYLVAKGWNVKFAYDFYDRNRDVSNDRDGQERFTLGVEPFLAQFVQVGLFYRSNRFIPQNASQNQDTLTLQSHFFF